MIATIRFQHITHLSTTEGWMAELALLADILRMVYPYKWLPIISCRSGAGQGKSTGQRPTFYHWATPLRHVAASRASIWCSVCKCAVRWRRGRATANWTRSATCWPGFRVESCRWWATATTCGTLATSCSANSFTISSYNVDHRTTTDSSSVRTPATRRPSLSRCVVFVSSALINHTPVFH